ncbi:MAG: hypothetical protein JXQ29_06165 [Planctomycetes bacterium]|nr:hypothetical protein [Planctomycetota bacterium]
MAPTVSVVDSLKALRGSTTDVSFRGMLEYLIAKTPSTVTEMTKEQAAEMFRSTTDWGRVTRAEIAHLEKLYHDVRMTPSCNRYLRDLVKRLKAGGGDWCFKRITVHRKKLLKDKNGTVWGIRGRLYVGLRDQCDTLERPLTGPKRCIAAGTYTMSLRSVYSSLKTDGMPPTSKNHSRIQVPNRQSERSGIQIHWGKDISWSDGCTLVGRYQGDVWQRQESEKAYKELLEAITGMKTTYQPADLAEWTLVPKVKLVATFVGEPN